jgi:flagellar biosynthesis/type III secretory pathway protein FliH
MGERYMLFEELLKDEYRAGKADGKEEGRTEGRVEGFTRSIVELLSSVGDVPETLRAKLQGCTAEQMCDLVKLAATAESVESFEAELDNLLAS